jgi:hypothetical protein
MMPARKHLKEILDNEEISVRVAYETGLTPHCTLYTICDHPVKKPTHFRFKCKRKNSRK